MSLGQGAPVVLEPPRLLECGRSLTEQDGIAREAKDTICPAVGGDHIHDFRGRTMTSAADQNVGGGPVAPPIRQQPDQDPGMFGPWRAGAGTEGGHDPGLRRPGKNAQRQIAMILIVMMRKRELLLAIRRILGVVQMHKAPYGRTLQPSPLTQGPARGAHEAYMPRLITSPSS
jgi:hypothetical protein